MKNNINSFINDIKKYGAPKYFDIFETYQNQINENKNKKEIIFVYGILGLLENQLKILETIEKDIFGNQKGETQKGKFESYNFPKIFGAKNFLIDGKTIFGKKETFELKNIIASQQEGVVKTLEKINEKLKSDFEDYQKKFKGLKEILPKNLFLNILGMQKMDENFSNHFEKIEEVFQEVKKQIILRSLDEKVIKNTAEKLEFLIKKISIFPSKKINNFELEMYLNQLFIEFRNLQNIFNKLDK